jgi:hypothetical protein
MDDVISSQCADGPYWALVEAYGGAYDVVIDSNLPACVPEVGGVISRSFGSSPDHCAVLDVSDYHWTVRCSSRLALPTDRRNGGLAVVPASRLVRGD